jgi:protein phosphatase PTC1
MVVRFYNKAVKEVKAQHSIGVEGDAETGKGAMSEADAIVSSVKKLQEETGETIHDRGAASGMNTVEEESQEPGPELNAAAIDAAKANKS